MAKKPTEKYVGLSAEDQVDTGTFGGEFTIYRARFDDKFDYGGATGNNTVAMLHLAGDEKTYPQAYSMGSDAGDNFAVVDGGKRLKSTGSQESIGRTTKAAVLFAQLQQLGVPAKLLHSGDISKLEGLHAQWIQRPLAEFTGRKSKTKEGAQIMVLVPSEIYLLPGAEETDDYQRFVGSIEEDTDSDGEDEFVADEDELGEEEEEKDTRPKTRRKPLAKSKAAAKEEEEEEEEEDPADDAGGDFDPEVAVYETVKAAGGSIKRTALPGKLLRLKIKPTQRKEVIAWTKKTENLKESELFSFDGKVLTVEDEE
jgi:hypothetical protein